jgi:hypothetical protein
MAKNVPNGQKCTKWPKMYQMTVIDIFQIAREYTNLFHSKEPPKFTEIGIFWFENKPSGNPATDRKFWFFRIGKLINTWLQVPECCNFYEVRRKIYEKVFQVFLNRTCR